MLTRLGNGLRASARAKNLLPVTFELLGSLPPQLTHSRAAVALYQDGNGDWHQAAADTPRFGYLYGSGGGLILEEAVTNRLQRTRAQNNTLTQILASGAMGTPSAQGVDQSAIITDSDAPTKNLSNGTNILECNNTLGNAVDLAFRGAVDGTANKFCAILHYKHISGPACSLRLDDFSGGTVAIGNLNTQSEWQTQYFANITATTSGQVLTIEVPAGSRIQICFINLQESPVPTAMIDQNGSTDVTRAADSLVDASPSWYNTTEGTFILDYEDLFPRLAKNYQSLLHVGDGGNNNRVAMVKNISGGDFSSLIVAGGNTALSRTLDNGVLINGRSKAALAYKANDHACALNGVTLQNSDSGNPPSIVTGGFSLGCLPDGSLPANIIVRFLKYYNTRLSNTQIEGLTRNTVVKPSTGFDKDLSVILFAGQSNSSGRSAGSAVYNNSIKLIGNDGILKNYADPYDNNTNQLFSPLADSLAAFSYAGTVLDNLTDNLEGSWAALPVNRGNTALSDWNTLPVNDRLYSAIQMGLLARSYGTLKVIVWHQGESDAIAGTGKASFKTGTQNLFNILWEHLGQIPIVIVSLHEWHSGTGAAEADWQAIQAGQSELAAALSNVSLVDISDLPGESSDEVHLDQAGLITAGERIANIIASLIA